MNIAILSTGSELLRGSVPNTNAAFLGRALEAHGFCPVLTRVAGDEAPSIHAGLAEALHAADTILITGGLGPTRDDLTLDAVARFFGRELTPDPALAEKVRDYWRTRHPGRTVPKEALRQARLLEGGEALANPNGSAPGLYFTARYAGRDRHLFLLPGPPRECEPMAENEVIPRLLQLGGEREFTLGFLVPGGGEFETTRLLERQLTGFAVRLGCCAQPEGTRIFLSGADRDEVERAVAAARVLLPAALPPGELDLALHLIGRLEERNWTLGTAESCTGGGIAARLTDYPGVSRVFKGGAVVYSNELKHALLGVPEVLLAEFGAVSAECARAMVDGACRVLAVDCAVAVTGVAGPDGGSAEKPVGLVYIAARAGERCEVREFHFQGDRRAVRERTAGRALLLLHELIKGENV